MQSGHWLFNEHIYPAKLHKKHLRMVHLRRGATSQKSCTNVFPVCCLLLGAMKPGETYRPLLSRAVRFTAHGCGQPAASQECAHFVWDKLSRGSAVRVYYAVFKEIIPHAFLFHITYGCAHFWRVFCRRIYSNINLLKKSVLIEKFLLLHKCLKCLSQHWKRAQVSRIALFKCAVDLHVR